MPNRRTRSISAGSRVGNIWWRRVSMIDRVVTDMRDPSRLPFLRPCLDLGVKPHRRQNTERHEGREHGELRDEKRGLRLRWRQWLQER